jgi:2-(1,2-epoxy-1,2-dihydrophenyl)acetyl-CoA isomerase
MTKNDSSYETILFSIEEGIARLTLNRPDKLNSFNVRMHEEVRQALQSVRGTGRTGAGAQRRWPRILRGPGSRGPGRGAGRAGRRSRRLDRALLQAAVLTLQELPMPVIAAVNGVAAGAGANIALACDLVVAARSASFVQAFCRLG